MRRSVLTELLGLYLLLVVIPTLLLGVYFYSELPTAMILTIVISILLFGVIMTLLVRRRILVPLHDFRSTLEDISEGFIIDEIPDNIFSKAEDVITDSFHKVIGINRMLLKNVDSLEKGFEEERLAKLAGQELTLAYERFVPHEFISLLRKDDIRQVRLGDVVKTDMTILFSDMRAFTTLSEKITPEENFEFLNSYLVKMEPIFKKHNGFIDKYIGDAIMALFQTEADHALRAAIEMLHTLHDFNMERQASGKQNETIGIGIGLNTGSAMLGIIGGVNRMDGTVVSDSVNLASRIEDLNKVYGTSLLISEHTYQQLHNPALYCIRIIDRVKVKGKSEDVRIYEVFDADPVDVMEAKLNTRPLFEEACVHFHQGRVEQAAELFLQCVAQNPQDQVAHVYLDRCQLKAGEVS